MESGAERLETPSIKERTGANGHRRLREFAKVFIDKMRRYDHSNHYNPHNWKAAGGMSCGGGK
jgi:hypothetical protein